jgi:hypothetical protein
LANGIFSLPIKRSLSSSNPHQALVELLERPDSHDHLTSQGEKAGHRPIHGSQTQRDSRDRAYVLRDPLAPDAISPGRSPSQDAVFVDELDGRTIQLRLQHVLDRAPIGQALTDALVESSQLPLLLSRVKAEHRGDVLDRLEALQRAAPHTLGGGIGSAESGVRLLQRSQLAE